MYESTYETEGKAGAALGIAARQDRWLHPSKGSAATHGAARNHPADCTQQTRLRLYRHVAQLRRTLALSGIRVPGLPFPVLNIPMRDMARRWGDCGIKVQWRDAKIYALRLPLDQASMGLGGNLPRLTSQARREHSRCRRSQADGVRPSVSRR